MTEIGVPAALLCLAVGYALDWFKERGRRRRAAEAEEMAREMERKRRTAAAVQRVLGE